MKGKEHTRNEELRQLCELPAGHPRESMRCYACPPPAREIMLRHVFGRPPGRRTMNVDLGIAVRDWDHLQLLKSALVEQGGFLPHARMVQRLIYPSKPSVVVDLIPFGGVESGDRVRLRLEHCLHVGRFKRKPAEHFSGCVVQCGCDRRRSERIRRLRAPTVGSDFRIIQQYDFDFRNV